MIDGGRLGQAGGGRPGQRASERGLAALTGVCATAVLIATLLVTVAPTARAATVAEGNFRVVPGLEIFDLPGLRYSAAPGETNELTITNVAGRPDAIALTDSAPIAAGQGCSPDGTRVICEVENLGGVFVDLANGGDSVDTSDLARILVQANAGPGSDTMTAGPTPSDFDGQNGDDVLRAGTTGKLEGDREISGGRGDDRLIGGDQADVLSGDKGDDRISGASGGDEISGGAGVDRLVGDDGADFLNGGAGKDRVDGRSGADRLGGGDGPDLVRGGTGPDTLGGNRGDDRVLGGPGGDIFEVREVFGTDDDDMIIGGRGRDEVEVLCPSCSVSLDGRPNDGRRRGGGHNVQVESVQTTSSEVDPSETRRLFGSGDDVLSGDSGANDLFAGRGDDLLRGNGGKDALSAGSGDDRVLAADARRDLVNCGPGVDSAVVDRIDRVRRCESVMR